MNLRTSVFMGDAPLVDILVSQVLPRAANTFLLGIPRRWRGDRMGLTVYVLASGILIVSYDGLKLQWQCLFWTVLVMSTFPSLKHVLLPVVLSGWCVLLCCHQRDTRMQLRTHVRCDVVVRCSPWCGQKAMRGSLDNRKGALRRLPRCLRRPPHCLRVVEVFAGCNIASFGSADNAS